MRDDRYRGTTFPKQVRKLCRMAEREADRLHPDRLRGQAVAALRSDADREISPEFRRLLQERDATPSFFDASNLAGSARSGLECRIARYIEADRSVRSADAIADALRSRGEGYGREHREHLIADLRPDRSLAAACFKIACDAGAPLAAALVLENRRRISLASDRVRLDEDLLAGTRL